MLVQGRVRKRSWEKMNKMKTKKDTNKQKSRAGWLSSFHLATRKQTAVTN